MATGLTSGAMVLGNAASFALTGGFFADSVTTEEIKTSVHGVLIT